MTFITTQSGLRYQDIVVGAGDEAKAGTAVEVHYIGWLYDTEKDEHGKEKGKTGEPFDSSDIRKHSLTFALTGDAAKTPKMVMDGWDEGIQGMKAGGTRLLIVPPELGYPNLEKNSPLLNATTLFEIKLLNVNAPAA